MGVADSEYELTFADPDASGGIFSIHTAIQQRPTLKGQSPDVDCFDFYQMIYLRFIIGIQSYLEEIKTKKVVIVEEPVVVKRKIWDIPLGMILLLCLNIGYVCLVYSLLTTDYIWQLIEGNRQLGPFALIGFIIWGCAFVGLSQFAYAIPMYLHFKKKGRPNISRGIAISVIITLVLIGLGLQSFF